MGRRGRGTEKRAGDPGGERGAGHAPGEPPGHDTDDARDREGSQRRNGAQYRASPITPAVRRQEAGDPDEEEVGHGEPGAASRSPRRAGPARGERRRRGTRPTRLRGRRGRARGRAAARDHRQVVQPWAADVLRQDRLVCGDLRLGEVLVGEGVQLEERVAVGDGADDEIEHPPAEHGQRGPQGVADDVPGDPQDHGDDDPPEHRRLPRLGRPAEEEAGEEEERHGARRPPALPTADLEGEDERDEDVRARDEVGVVAAEADEDEPARQAAPSGAPPPPPTPAVRGARGSSRAAGTEEGHRGEGGPRDAPQGGDPLWAGHPVRV